MPCTPIWAMNTTTTATSEARAENRSDLGSASFAGEAKVLNKLTAMLDFGLARAGDTSTSTPAAYALAGARYELTEHIDLDWGQGRPDQA